jgi:predicted PurR-regulated permease PerM
MVFILVDFLDGFNINGGFEKYISEFVTQISGVSGGVVSTTLSIFENVTTLFSLLVICIYMSLDWINMKTKFYAMFPKKLRDDAIETVGEVETNIGEWIKGQLFLMLVIGLVSFLGLFVLGVDYAIALGLISGLLEFVPMLGPVLSAVLAGVIGFSMSPVKGFGVIILFVLIQQLENNLLVPKVMQKVSGFSPLVILLSLLIGSEFFGLVGALTAVPVTMIGSIILKRVLNPNGRY